MKFWDKSEGQPPNSQWSGRDAGNIPAWDHPYPKWEFNLLWPAYNRWFQKNQHRLSLHPIEWSLIRAYSKHPTPPFDFLMNLGQRVGGGVVGHSALYSVGHCVVTAMIIVNARGASMKKSYYIQKFTASGSGPVYGFYLTTSDKEWLVTGANQRRVAIVCFLFNFPKLD